MALLTLKFVTDVKDTSYEVIEFHGELDKSTISNAEKQILDFLENFRANALILDLTNLKFINSEGLGFIVSIHTKLVKRKAVLALCGLKNNIKDIVEVIGLPKIINVFDSVTDAIHHVNRL